MEPPEATIRFWLDPIPPEEMPMLAAQTLAEGQDLSGGDERLLAAACALAAVRRREETL